MTRLPSLCKRREGQEKRSGGRFDKSGTKYFQPLVSNRFLPGSNRRTFRRGRLHADSDGICYHHLPAFVLDGIVFPFRACCGLRHA